MTLRAWIVSLAAAFAVTINVAAQEIAVPTRPETNGPRAPVTAWNGSYVDKIEIDVPAFHGLQPDIDLNYDSARGLRNIPTAGGILGVGWSIGGLSTIERVAGSAAPAVDTDVKGAGRGVGAYGAPGLPPDGFALDGSELVLCAHVQNPASTPSCSVPTAAGEVGYAARNENFMRIRNITANNSWEITSKSGVKSTYTSSETIDSFRWNLATVQDRRGNRVTYNWNCATGQDCVIQSIAMTQMGQTLAFAEVIFHTDTRPDPISYATGKDIRVINQRTRAIEVKSAGARLRVYGLTYELSAATGLSRLVKVQQFGDDSDVDADGVVTGVTSLPPVILVYSNSDLLLNFVSSSWPVANTYLAIQNSVAPGVAWAFGGDFDGDGRRMDLLYTFIQQTVYQSNGMHQYGCRQSGSFRTGSKYSDMIGVQSPQYSCTYAPNNADYGHTTILDSLPIADYDGDGSDEFSSISKVFLGCQNSNDTNCSYRLDLKIFKWFESSANPKSGWYGSVAGYSAPVSETTTDFYGGVHTVADFTGDGAADILTRTGLVWSKSGSSFSAIFSTTATFPSVNPNSQFIRRLDASDVNGDGYSDLLEQWFEAGLWKSKIHLSTGKGFVPQTVQVLPWALNFDSSGWLLTDANGDMNRPGIAGGRLI